MRLNVSLRAKTLRDRLDGYAKRLSADQMAAAAPAVYKAMRQGPRGISDQFRSGIGYFQNNTAIRWDKTKAFGNRPAPTRTLIRSGAYRDAWMGRGVGSIEDYSQGRFVFGVDQALFPQVGLFQKLGPTRIPVTEKMRNFLAWKFGVYLKKKTKWIVNPGRRPVGISAEMVARSAQAIKKFVLSGKAAAVSGASEREVA